MTKIKHAYKAGTSFVGYVWNTFLYYLYTVLYFIFRVIYVPLTIIHKLSFIAGFLIPGTLAVFLLKDYYPPDYSLMMCVKAHADAGIFNSSFIGKYVLYGIGAGIALFAFFFIITHMFANVGQWINDKIIHTEEVINGYGNSVKKHTSGFNAKKLSDAQIMEAFKKSDNYLPPSKMFGIKKTTTEYYNL